MKIINDKIRKSVVIEYENIEEDLSLYLKEGVDRNTLIQWWVETCSKKFFEDNSDIDDVLLFRFINGKRGLEWVVSKETEDDKWIYQSCKPTEHRQKWLDECNRIMLSSVKMESV
jgi:uncharacterized protein (DUF924 family)